MNSDVTNIVYQQFDPAPLRADQTDLYVDLDEVRGSMDLVNRLANRVRLANKATSQVLAGHRGSGKSTELRRLQRNLEIGKPPVFVVYVDVDDDIDLNDVDFPEILIAIVRQMAEQLKNRLEISLKPGLFTDRWKRLKHLLGTIELDGVELSAQFLTLAATMKSSPDARLEIRKLLEPDTSNWLYAANDLIGVAKQELDKKGYSDLAIVVDDLDKMVLRPHHSAECSTGEYLFVHRVAQLTDFHCHMVYTMPLALAYSTQERVIATLYGGAPLVIPMTKLWTCQGKKYEPGRKKFRQIVEQRLKRAGAASQDVFKEKAVVDRLIELSGGQPRELMLLIRESIIGSGLPITAESVRRSEREGNRAYARQLRREHWRLLQQIRNNPDYCRSEDTDSVFRDLLDSRAILQYVNDKEWYRINPLVPEPPDLSGHG